MFRDRSSVCGWPTALVLLLALLADTPGFAAENVAAAESFLEFPTAAGKLSQLQSRRLTTLLSEPAVAEAELVVVRPPTDLLRTGRLKLRLPGHREALLEETYREHPSPDSVAWFGRSEDGTADAGWLLLAGQLTGRASIDGFAYEISPLGGDLHLLARVERLEKPEEAIDHPPEPIASLLAAPAPIPAGRPLNRHGHNCGFDRTGWVDVLSVFTPTVTANGLVNLLHGRLLWGISDFNYSLSNSLVARRDVRLRLVGFEEAAISELGNIEAVSQDLRSDNAVATLRDNLNADLVVLHTFRSEFTTIFPGGTARGFVPQIPATRETAFAVVAGTSFDVFTRRTFQHEIGHLFGGVHHDGTPPAGHPSYSRGFSRKGFRSIMTGGFVTRWPNFSSSTIQVGGGSTGTAMMNDVARLLGERGPLVAAFEQDPMAPLSVMALGPGSLSPGAFGHWTAEVCGGVPPFVAEWRTSTNGFQYTGVLSTAPSFQTHMPGPFMIVKLTVTDGAGTTRNHFKYVIGQ